MKIMLVVVFLSYSQYTNTMTTTTWKKNMQTEARCHAMANKIRKASPRLKVWCESNRPRGQWVSHK